MGFELGFGFGDPADEEGVLALGLVDPAGEGRVFEGRDGEEYGEMGIRVRIQVRIRILIRTMVLEMRMSLAGRNVCRGRGMCVRGRRWAEGEGVGAREWEWELEDETKGKRDRVLWCEGVSILSRIVNKEDGVSA